MTWSPFSAEAVKLDTVIRRLHKDGRITDAIAAIEKALERARLDGPSNTTYEQFENQYL
jgi:hypothetical protein